MAETLPRFRQALEKIEDTKKLAKILIEAAAEAPPDSNGRVYRKSADGHNHARRRGLPLISRGVAGTTSPGTGPAPRAARQGSPRRALEALVSAALADAHAHERGDVTL